MLRKIRGTLSSEKQFTKPHFLFVLSVCRAEVSILMQINAKIHRLPARILSCHHPAVGLLVHRLEKLPHLEELEVNMFSLLFHQIFMFHTLGLVRSYS